jgi:protein-tyrosine phosphatase
MKILFVCLGNICRSPTAVGVMRHLSALQVDSAGTAAYHIGNAPDPRSQRAALGRGIDLSGLRARQLHVGDFDHFDLILAMDRANLAHLKKICPPASGARLGLFLDFAPHLNTREVPDPYYGTDADFERVLDLCFEAGRGLIKAGATSTGLLMP